MQRSAFKKRAAGRSIRSLQLRCSFSFSIANYCRARPPANSNCTPVPHPDSDIDWLRNTIANNHNILRWLEDPELMAWLDAARLDLLGHLRPRLPADPARRDEIARPMRTRLTAVNDKLQSLLGMS